MARRIFSVFKDKRGVSALEYAILAAVVVVAVSAAVGTSNTTNGVSALVKSAFAKVNTSISGVQ